MEIEIHGDEQSLYTITINDRCVIQTTVAEARSRHRRQRTVGDYLVNDWVREIRKMYGKKKKPQTLAIGLSAEHSVNYGNGNLIYPASKAKDAPYEILQICVGNHCLIYEPCYGRPICKSLRELLSDNNAFIFGVGMEGAAEKIEKDFGVKLSKPWDLRKLAECSKDAKQGCYRKYNLEKLATVVLGTEWELTKPGRINWFDAELCNWYDRSLSVEKIKYGTVEVFLAHEMGMNFLENGTIEAFAAYKRWQKHLN